MSKAVKAVGRAVSKVVKGVANVVKKVASSKLGKVLIAAAAVYFGGAALTGALGSSGAAAAGGLSGLSGAAANISAAWSSLGTAGSALMSGNLSGAGSAVASGFTGTAATGGSALAGATGGAAGGAFTGATSTGLPTVAADAANVLASGGGAAGAGAGAGAGSLSQGLIGAAKINAATQLVGGTLQGYGQQKQYEQQMADAERLRAEQEARYRKSVDDYLAYSKSSRPQDQPFTPAGPAYDPVLEARSIASRYILPPANYSGQPSGLINSQFGAGPVTNNNFPVYNPRIYG